jgi:predicted extracellular nuclease
VWPTAGVAVTRYHVAFWNLENLFAPEGHPGREPWIAQRLAGDLAGWTDALFRQKLARLAEVIAFLNGGQGPDLLGVCEVENKFVLDELIAVLHGVLPQRNYAAVHVDATRDQRGIDTAFLYDRQRLGTVPTEVFSHWVMRRTGTRDITQATFTTQANRPIIVLANHWPSRSGGAEESRGFRMTAGETLGYWHERIREERGVDIPVLAFGDFNDEPFDASLCIHANSTRERDDVLRARSARFYNLAWRYLAQTVTDQAGVSRTLHGSLYFNGNGNLFDQILVSPSLLKTNSAIRVLDDTAKSEPLPAMVDRRAAPAPRRFGLAKGNAAQNVDVTGYADHFPVSVVVEEG